MKDEKAPEQAPSNRMNPKVDAFLRNAKNWQEELAKLRTIVLDCGLTEGSIVITSNRPPEDWFSIFPDQIVGGAIMDRLVSGAVKLIVTSGRSFRKEGTLRNQISEPAA
ncbi:hypothetical protein SPIROBIBN47_90041 [uncultured spirochete]|uniref:IstB-like ATP-binding domain-containing protein n=1 Tax=uncultured spirochete TaxID=156406 RepID=A0A3P3XLZ0_9SPIR|nr:ATP-binding protein [Rectinema subterraneum]SLM15970.1 hypothetical protein SPIROBIBN47_90041 [uncultured spirochete]